MIKALNLTILLLEVQLLMNPNTPITLYNDPMKKTNYPPQLSYTFDYWVSYAWCNHTNSSFHFCDNLSGIKPKAAWYDSSNNGYNIFATNYNFMER